MKQKIQRRLHCSLQVSANDEKGKLTKKMNPMSQLRRKLSLNGLKV